MATLCVTETITWGIIFYGFPVFLGAMERDLGASRVVVTGAFTHAVTGAKQSLLGRTRRADGRMQVTYRRHPLYRFSGDTRKGLTSGQGLGDFGGKWWVVSPAGNKIVTGGSAGPGY